MKSEERAEIDELYRGVIRLHKEVKGLIIGCEKIERNQNANISAIAELRSAFDHVIRTHNVMYGVETEESVIAQTNMSAYDYCKSNMNKALGHLCRAGYDAHDIISISLSGKIRDVLKDRSYEALYHVITDYVSMSIKIDAAEALIISAKSQKDVQTVDIEQVQFQSYADASDTLQSIYNQLTEVMPQVITYEEEQKTRQKAYEDVQKKIREKMHRQAIVITIVVSIITTTVGIVITLMVK